MATEETNRHMKEFIAQARRNQLAVFGQFLSEEIRDMADASNFQKEEARRDEELELTEEDRPLIKSLIQYDPTRSAGQIRGDPPYQLPANEAFMIADLFNDRVIIRGTYGSLFEGGFQILETGNLVYMPRIPDWQNERIPGWEGYLLFNIDISLWKFIQNVACMVGEPSAVDYFANPPGGNGNGNGGAGDSGGNVTQHLHSTPKIPHHQTTLRRMFSQGPSTILHPRTRRYRPRKSAQPVSTTREEEVNIEAVNIHMPIKGPLYGFITQDIEQLAIIQSQSNAQNVDTVIRLMQNYLNTLTTCPTELSQTNFLTRAFLQWHNHNRPTAIEAMCPVSLTIP